MDVQVGQELLDELSSTLENLETQQGALLQCLKDKGVVTDEQLAPYLTQASNASNIRWRAARLRLERILSGAQQKEEEIKKQQAKPTARTQSFAEKESDQPGSAVKAGTETEEKKTTKSEGENKRTEEDTAGAKQQNFERLESGASKAEGEAKPPAKDGEKDAA